MAQSYVNTWYSVIKHDNNIPLLFIIGPSLFKPNLKYYKVTLITIILVLTAAGQKISGDMPTLNLKPAQNAAIDFNLKKDLQTGIVSASMTELTLDAATAAEWQIGIKDDKSGLMAAANVSNMLVTLEYEATFS